MLLVKRLGMSLVTPFLPDAALPVATSVTEPKTSAVKTAKAATSFIARPLSPRRNEPVAQRECLASGFGPVQPAEPRVTSSAMSRSLLSALTVLIPSTRTNAARDCFHRCAADGVASA